MSVVIEAGLPGGVTEIEPDGPLAPVLDPSVLSTGGPGSDRDATLGSVQTFETASIQGLVTTARAAMSGVPAFPVPSREPRA